MNVAKGPFEKFLSTDILFILKDFVKGKHPLLALNVKLQSNKGRVANKTVLGTKSRHSRAATANYNQHNLFITVKKKNKNKHCD